MNRLSSEQSAYLRSAAAQPVHWFPWGKEAFEKALHDGKPVLLDIGAVWCHWCHVMDMESYEHEEIARIINEKFIAIKVDRDERPDIDARYQASVSALSGQGGWPLTAFLMPDGRAFYGGTYFPPEDRHGRPGFPKVLLALAETYRTEYEKVLDNANRLNAFVAEQLNRSAIPDELSDELLDNGLNSASRSFDIRHGGFGGAPKFPHPGVIDLLLACYDRTGEEWMLNAVRSSLRAMGRGGIYDQLQGGFHRYSTDERWVVPHFEKMLYDNAPLLGNYVRAFQATRDEFLRDRAIGILRFVAEVLSDSANGGFYASQDADVTFGDDGSYFTWTMADLQGTVDKAEFEVLQPFYDVYERGEMHHDPSQNVLFMAKSTEEIASLLEKPREHVEKALLSGKEKLLRARNRRKSPFVDQTIYASWNGMMISAYFEAYKVFEEEFVNTFAARSLERILREYTRNDGLISHRAAMIAQDAFLDDQVFVVAALLDAFEVTGSNHYLARAEELMLQTIGSFWDDTSGGFNDLPKLSSGFGILALPLRSIQDSPTPAANSVAVISMERLFAFTEKPVFREHAEKTLRSFAGVAKDHGILGGMYFLALERFLHPPLHIVILAEENDPEGSAMHARALKTYRNGTTVARINPAGGAPMPSAMRAARVERLPAAYACTARSCATPVFDAESLERTIKEFGRSNA